MTKTRKGRLKEFVEDQQQDLQEVKPGDLKGDVTLTSTVPVVIEIAPLELSEPVKRKKKKKHRVETVKPNVEGGLF